MGPISWSNAASGSRSARSSPRATPRSQIVRISARLRLGQMRSQVGLDERVGLRFPDQLCEDAAATAGVEVRQPANHPAKILVRGAGIRIGRFGHHLGQEGFDGHRVLVGPPLVDRRLAGAAAAGDLLGGHGPQTHLLQQLRRGAQHRHARLLAARAAWAARLSILFGAGHAYHYRPPAGLRKLKHDSRRARGLVTLDGAGARDPGRHACAVVHGQSE